MLGIVACLLVLVLLPQLQQTLAGSNSSDNGSRRCSNGKCQLLVQSLPGLAAVAVSQLRPLQFRARLLERGFQGCAVRSKRAIDVFLSSLWCLLVFCTSLRVSWQTAAGAAGVAGEAASGEVLPADKQQSSPCWCLLGFCRLPASDHDCAAAAFWTLAVPPSALLLMLPMAALLLLAWRAPDSRHLAFREPLHVLSRLAMISSGLNAASQLAGSWLVLLTLLHALTVACTMLRFSAFIPMQLMQTVALLLCTQGASLLPGLQLIAAVLSVPSFIVLHVEAAARQAFLSGGLSGAELGTALPYMQTKRLSMWGSSMQSAVAAGLGLAGKAAASPAMLAGEPDRCCSVKGDAASNSNEGGQAGSS
jgi:hypothetical protein